MSGRRKKRRFMVYLGILVVLVCFGITGLHQVGKLIPRLQAKAVLSGESTSEEDWALVLVNKWNPIKDKTEIETTELWNGKRVDKRIYPYLQEMFDAMRKDGVYPVVASGYRTREEQQKLYDEKIQAYINEGYSKEQATEQAQTWVAVPGTSEHELGLGIDINADGIHSTGDEVYQWLEKNAHLYGFIYRYPQDKTEITGISNEPWHYRYVGVKAAAEIREQGICLEEYLEEKETF